MTLLNFEMKRNRIALAVWTAAIALLLTICLLIFPDMKDQVNELNAAFSSMGGFTEAFGMDRLNFGELMGFYGLECGNILGIGGAFFAAYLGITALADEEKNHTAEYLFHTSRQPQTHCIRKTGAHPAADHHPECSVYPDRTYCHCRYR